MIHKLCVKNLKKSMLLLILICVFNGYFFINFSSLTKCFFVTDCSQNHKSPNSKLKTSQIASNQPIRIIHQSWKNKNIPPQFLIYSKSWIEDCYKNWSYHLWTDEDNLNLVKTYYPWFLKRYNSFSHPIYRVDSARYIYMHRFGGIYTDLDNECLLPFEHLLTNYSLVFGAMAGQFAGTNLKEGYVQNSFFYSIPNHPFWLELLQAINLSKINDLLPEYITGPVMLSKFIESYIIKNPNDETIKIYEPKYFNPFSWLQKANTESQCKDKGRMTEKDWQLCRSYMRERGSFVVQYHHHFW